MLILCVDSHHDVVIKVGWIFETIQNYLPIHPSCVDRSNEFARQTTGEAGKAAQARAQLFDITFLMLCHIIQLHGMEVSADSGDSNDSFGGT